MYIEAVKFEGTWLCAPHKNINSALLGVTSHIGREAIGSFLGNS